MPESAIIIRNATEENVRIAVFRRSPKNISMGTYAWKIIAPPINGQTRIPLSNTYQVFLNFPLNDSDRTDPFGGERTAIINIDEFTSRFTVNLGENDLITLNQVFDHLVQDELHINNVTPKGVWTHIAQDGDDIYKPRVLSPQSTYIATNPGDAYFLAIVSGNVVKGTLLAEEEISNTITPIAPDQTATISGSLWSGYTIEVS